MCKRSVATRVLGVAIVAVLLLALTTPVFGDNEDHFLGYVDDGQFLRIFSVQEVAWPVGLTTISMQESIPPEAGELDLSALEGRVMVVQGWDGGGWIYRAVIVDVASALLSQLVLEVVGFPGQSACEVCLGRLNSATRAEFEETGHVDAALAEAMLAVRPFSLKSCEGAHTIELLLANIQGIDEAQGKRIVMCFCPELYE